MDFGLGKPQPTYTIADSGSDRQWVIQPNTPREVRNLLHNTAHREFFVRPYSAEGEPTEKGIWVREDRLVKVERPAPKTFVDQHLNTSGLCVTRDEALDYFAFVMMTAANLFEAIEDDKPSRDELIRILKSRGESEDGPMIGAALAYFDTAKRIHDDMKSED